MTKPKKVYHTQCLKHLGVVHLYRRLCLSIQLSYFVAFCVKTLVFISTISPLHIVCMVPFRYPALYSFDLFVSHHPIRGRFARLHHFCFFFTCTPSSFLRFQLYSLCSSCFAPQRPCFEEGFHFSRDFSRDLHLNRKILEQNYRRDMIDSGRSNCSFYFCFFIAC